MFHDVCCSMRGFNCIKPRTQQVLMCQVFLPAPGTPALQVAWFPEPDS